jgi:hypothetical protein
MKIKKYTVIFTCDENGGLHCKRQNEGFNAFEILGMLENVQIQIVQIMHGKIEIPIENTKISILDKERITIDYVIKNHEISERLKSALKGYMDYYKEVMYLDQVDATLMRKRIRNVGRFTEMQLIELKEKLLNK